MRQYKYEYPRPALTADVIPLRWYKQELQVLLIRRAQDPFKNQWALPGGFVNENETPLLAAIRECAEETSIEALPEQMVEVACFGTKDRDPRSWTVSVVFVALLDPNAEAMAQDDAKEVCWYSWQKLVQGQEDLAFDHQDMIDKAHALLQKESLTSPKLLGLLEKPFRSRHARHLYRQLWGDSISPRAFKAWLKKVDLVERSGRALYRAKSKLRLPWV